MASHMRALVQVPAIQLLTQLPANAPGKAMEDGHSAWAPTTAVRDPNGVLPAGSGLAQIRLLQLFGE